MTSRIHGIAETKRALEKVQLQVRAAAPAASRAGGEAVARNLIARVPRRTGRTAASIRVDMEGDTAKVGAETPYDRFVQKGTRYMSAQPYGEEAASETAPVAAVMSAVMKAAIPR